MAANVQSMCQYWKNFDLLELQKELDTTATELANKQDESEASRKKLVEQSREFKKSTPEDIRRVVAPLLKSFQSEVDSLSKRSKLAEASFLNIYKKLIDIPDPTSVLEHALELQKRAHKAQDLDLENKKLRETLEEYNHEFAEVKNQEVTIKGLREKLKEHEDKMEATAQSRAKDKERELQRQFAEKERQLQETQLTVAKKLGEAEHKVSTLQSALESTQSELFDLKAKYDEATSAKSDEMEMIMADLERANERAANAERECERLKAQLASATQNLQQAEQMSSAPDMEQAIDILKRSSLEVELAAKEKEISQLVEDVQRLQGTVTKLRDSGSTQVAKLEEELHDKTRTLKVLEERLKTQEDYGEVKRELGALKSIEFTNTSTEEADQKTKTLETLLLEKNRSLQTDNTQLKVTNADLTGRPTEPSLTNTEVFASMLGQELVSKYHRQNQLDSSKGPASGVGLAAAAPTTPQSRPLTNGLNFERGSSPPAHLTPPAAHSKPYRGAASAVCLVTEGRKTESPSHRSTPSTTPTPTHSLAPPSGPPQRSSSSTGSLSSSDGGGGSGGAGSGSGTSTLALAQVLDTADVSQKIREILSSHNIGQRLFAKHVLGLSQGTVSELLSKPKHWDKLTEKGRESYRKMYSWAIDESNITALKAISPKKEHSSKRHSFPTPASAGAPSMVSTSYTPEDAATEDRINQILSEAQAAMQAKQNQEKAQITNAMVASIYQQELAKMAAHQTNDRSPSKADLPPSLTGSTNNNNNNTKLRADDSDHNSNSGGNMVSRSRRTQNDSGSLTQEIVARIYQEELAKLAAAAQKSGNIAECTMYQQELARLAQNAQRQQHHHHQVNHRRGTANGLVTGSDDRSESNADLSDNDQPKDFSMPKVKTEPKEESASGSTADSSSPRLNTRDGASDAESDGGSGTPEMMRHAGSAFFLVRPRPGSTTPGPAFDAAQFNNATSGHTKIESLSPLQRMQSIANSLMTKGNQAVTHQRPLKAVLPPISQEEFDKYANVNTDELVKKVKDTLSQFSISQRLFGEHVLGLSQGSVSDLLARPKPWHMLTQKGREPFIRMQIFIEDPEAIPKLVANQYRIPPDKLMRTNTYAPPTPTASPVSSINMSPDLPTSVSHVAMSVSSKSRPPSTPPHALDVAMPSAAGQPSMYEVAAMTSELDTLAITSKVKEVLQFHNLGQKLFGEAILGLSQGSVSELLSKPKPWPMLSLKGREPFIKMHMWLNDPMKIERLRVHHSETKDKKRRSSNEQPLDMQVPQKKARVFFTEEQKDTLRLAYAQDPYPNQSTIECLAAQLGVTSKTIVNWFHNHRMRAKQQQHREGYSPDSVSSIKLEPEDYSNCSDHSMSSDTSSQLKSSQNSETSQWMFPTFHTFAGRKSARYSKLQEQNVVAFTTITEQKQLIQQLEDDLRSVNALSSLFRGDAEGEAQSHSAEYVADAVKDVLAPQMYPAGDTKSAADSLLPIIQSQRERFRIRAQELEAQTVAQQQQVVLLQNEMDKLRSDNVKLYEKIKFLQTFPTKGTSLNEDAESRYSSQYEERLDPFSSFSRKEKQRKYMNLSPYDKVTLSMGRFIMGNKVARTITFFYTILLHLLVFLVLYKLAYTTSCKRDFAVDYHQKLADHMAQAHGDLHWKG